ncbi:Uncharacterized protein dnm_016340 [Desulfonema magnum]|uniref:Uncharacterized protein n=1 Tax=Desulfonema magnum TaxID=45655 RepID=A0A975BHW1_9BACT|nr:Uncharacterized protein dnm_016340 [Desulfonema magnum]
MIKFFPVRPDRSKKFDHQEIANENRESDFIHCLCRDKSRIKIL